RRLFVAHGSAPKTPGPKVVDSARRVNAFPAGRTGLSTGQGMRRLAMTIAVSTFGELNGRPVHQFRLKSETGVEVDIIEFGVVVRDWRVPVDGALRTVVLGFDRFEDYLQHSPFFGAIAGRVANRIAGARFELEGRTYAID